MAKAKRERRSSIRNMSAGDDALETLERLERLEKEREAAERTGEKPPPADADASATTD